MLIPSNARPAAPSPTANTPSVAPSEPRSLRVDNPPTCRDGVGVRPIALCVAIRQPRGPGALSGWLRRARDLRDLVREVDLAVVLGTIADRVTGVGDGPEAVGVAADPVDDEERDAVLVADRFRLHHPDRLLDLVASREIGAERPMHRGDV